MSEPSSTFDRLQQARAAALALKEGEPGYESAVAGVLLAEVAHRAWAAAHDQPASAPWARSTVPNVGGVRRLLTDALGGNSARKRARSADGGWSHPCDQQSEGVKAPSPNQPRYFTRAREMNFAGWLERAAMMW